MPSPIINIEDSNFQSEISENKGATVLLVYMEGCPHCDYTWPAFEALAQSPDLGEHIKFGWMDCDDAGAKNTVRRLGVHAFPTLLFFKAGEIIDRHVGGVRQADLEQLLRRVFEIPAAPATAEKSKAPHNLKHK